MRGCAVSETVPRTVLLPPSWKFLLKTLPEAGIFLVVLNIIVSFS
jgi:hypothetical protein